jgi:hypothetical protein
MLAVFQSPPLTDEYTSCMMGLHHQTERIMLSRLELEQCQERASSEEGTELRFCGKIYQTSLALLLDIIILE